MTDYISRQAAIEALAGWNISEIVLVPVPAADVRENIHAKKIISGGEHDGATCWFECSHCHGSVNINDAYCKHCGAVLEYEK